MSNGDWAAYVQRVTAGLTQMQIADTTGVAQAAISRWLRGETEAPRAEYVVSFARALNNDPVEALVAAGYITAAEAGSKTQVRTPLAEFADSELIAELTRRLG